MSRKPPAAGSPRPSERRYSFFDTTLAVAADEPTAIAWLDEFLTPAFAPGGDRAPDFAVRLRRDAAAFSALLATRPPGGVAEIPCFALDREVRRRQAWTSDGTTVLEGRSLDLLVRLHGRSVEILVESEAWSGRTTAMRVIRELATARSLASPERVLLHAAGLECAGRGLLLAGPKRSGKTTLLASLAAAAPARLLANDRVLVAARDGGFEARGVPTIARVRPATAALLADSLGRVRRVARAHECTLAEAAERPLADEGGALRLSPLQLARALAVELAPAAEIAAIAFPERPQDGNEVGVVRLDRAESERRLRGARFGPSAAAEPTVFERMARSPRPALADESMFRRLAAALPCFTVSLGAGRLADPRAARTVIESCLGS